MASVVPAIATNRSYRGALSISTRLRVSHRTIWSLSDLTGTCLDSPFPKLRRLHNDIDSTFSSFPFCDKPMHNKSETPFASQPAILSITSSSQLETERLPETENVGACFTPLHMSCTLVAYVAPSKRSIVTVMNWDHQCKLPRETRSPLDCLTSDCFSITIVTMTSSSSSDR